MTRLSPSRLRLTSIGLAILAGLATAPVPSSTQDVAGTRFPLTGVAHAVQGVASDGPASGAVRQYSSGVIRTWHDVAAAQPTNPVRQSRVLAMVHAAMHDAVNGAIPVYETHASHLWSRYADPEAAAAAAAHRVLVELFPSSSSTFDMQLSSSLASIPAGDARDAGVELGSDVGELIVDIRAGDGMDVPDPFLPIPGPGVWEPTPPAFAAAVEPQMQNVTPFTIRRRDRFDVEPPPGLLTDEYARDYQEVKAVGRQGSTLRDADQTHAAHFWFEASSVGWSRIAALQTLQTGAGLHDTARLFALLNMAMADGYIAGFYWKRTYGLWRPITAIRHGDADGNAETEPDPAWSSLRPTPPSAEYPSTHAVLGAAAAQILRHVSGSDRFGFCMASASSTPPGTERCFTRFSEASAENAASRVYIGYHFRFATEAGRRLGKQIGNIALRQNLRPLHPPRR